MAEGDADVVEAFEQAVTAETVDLETDRLAALGADFLAPGAPSGLAAAPAAGKLHAATRAPRADQTDLVVNKVIIAETLFFVAILFHHSPLLLMPVDYDA